MKSGINIYVDGEGEESLHFHQEVELLYVFEGKVELAVLNDQFSMNKNDIIVINANFKHQYTVSQGTILCKLQIPYQFLCDNLGYNDIIFGCNSMKEENEAYAKLNAILIRLLGAFVKNDSKQNCFSQQSLLYQLLDILVTDFLISNNDKLFLEKNKDERMYKINNYIQSNYNKAITLKDLSEYLFLSMSYLSRYFKKNYGMNFLEYLSSVRMHHAMEDLLFTDLNITRIAVENGFANSSVFSKKFKELYQVSPSQYRNSRGMKGNEKKEGSTELENIIKEKLEEYFENHDIITEKIESKKELYIVEDVKLGLPAEKKNVSMVNIGSASELLRFDVQKQITLIKEKIGVRYLRFWNPFSKEFKVEVTNPNQDYNFDKLDQIIDCLLDNQLKPFIDLGTKPKRIQKETDMAIVYDDIFQFESLEQWKNVIKAWILHLKARYGVEEIEQWYFELWRREDVIEDNDDYFSFFNAAYEIIKTYIPDAKVGGYGLKIRCPSEIKKELEAWKRQKYDPDFVSAYCYSYMPITQDGIEYHKRSTDDDFLKNRLMRTKEILREVNFPTQELYITEWNLTISERNDINDTSFKGAYIAKNMIDTIEDVKILGYFMGSDCCSEHIDSSKILNGATGLITKDGILKPAAYAMKFMNQLGRRIVAKGRNYIISQDKNFGYRILCHNYKKLSNCYYLMEESEIDIRNKYKLFEDEENLNLKIQLKNVINGRYQVKVYKVNKNSGSISDEWEKLDYSSEMTKDDIEYLKNICTPSISMQYYNIDKDVLNFELKLIPNEVDFVQIILMNK